MTVEAGRIGKITDHMLSRLAANNVYIAIHLLLKKVNAKLSVARVRFILQFFYVLF